MSDSLIQPAEHDALAAEPAATPAGPWGQLQLVPIVIAPPLQFVGDLAFELGPRFWNFPRTDRGSLEQLFGEADLPAAEADALLDGAQFETAFNGWQLRPREKLERSLGPEARGRIYNVLSCFAENPLHHNAYRFCGRSLDQSCTSSNCATSILGGTPSRFGTIGAAIGKRTGGKGEFRLDCSAWARREDYYLPSG
jgi:hypothetical protein